MGRKSQRKKYVVKLLMVTLMKKHFVNMKGIIILAYVNKGIIRLYLKLIKSLTINVFVF